MRTETQEETLTDHEEENLGGLLAGKGVPVVADEAHRSQIRESCQSILDEVGCWDPSAAGTRVSVLCEDATVLEGVSESPKMPSLSQN